MTIYTPGGMPISFPMNYAFTLLARLYPKYRPHQVLKLAEGMDAAPEAIAYLVALVLFALRLSPLTIFIGVLFVRVIVLWMQIRSQYFAPIVSLGVVFSSIGKLGILSIGLAVLGWYLAGWQGLVALLCALLLGSSINTLLEAQARNRIRAMAGTSYSEFDRYFVDAYRFCATKLDVSLDLSTSPQELGSDRWQFVCEDYAQQNPTLFEMKKFS